MQEILNKIERIIEEELPSCCNANYMKDGCVYKMKNVIAKAKEIIQAEQKEPLTIGDKIREDNESLAKHLANLQHLMGDNTDIKMLAKQHEAYLNQPYTEDDRAN